MKITKKDSALIKAEIEAEIFKQAFIKLAFEFAQRHPDSFAFAADPLATHLHRVNPYRFYPSEQTGNEELTLKQLQQDYFGSAIRVVGESVTSAQNSRRRR